MLLQAKFNFTKNLKIANKDATMYNSITLIILSVIMTYSQRDRFINPVPRNHRDVVKAKLNGVFDAEMPSDYQEHLAYTLFGATSSNIRNASILYYKPDTSHPKADTTPPYKLSSERILDCPELIKDYYLNPLCWGYPLIYIGLGFNLYFHNPLLNSSGEIPSDGLARITALAATATYVARADDEMHLQTIDTQTCAVVNTKNSGCVFSQIIPDGEQFYLSSKNNQQIKYYDPRTNSFPFSFGVALPPIGIAYNPLSKTLGISTPESIKLYDARNPGRVNSAPAILEFKGHKPPSKALAFFGQNKIASGGGIADKYVKIWNSQTGQSYSEVHTEAQVSDIHWIDRANIAVTSGDHKSAVSIYRQKASKLRLDAENTMPAPVIYSAQNPGNKKEIATVSKNEVLGLWSVKTVQTPITPESDLLTGYQIR